MSEVKDFEEKMNKSINSLKEDFATIRAGRANPHVLDKVTVDYYGVDTPLGGGQIGNISVPEARMLQIQPYDPSMLKAIEKAIQTSDLGLNPSNDGKVIRIVFPELTEERRKALTKDIKKKGEDSKVAIRNIRRDAIDTFKKEQKSSEITEDDYKSLEEDIQKLTDKFIKDIDTAVEAKNKDIMSI